MKPMYHQTTDIKHVQQKLIDLSARKKAKKQDISCLFFPTEKILEIGFQSIGLMGC